MILTLLLENTLKSFALNRYLITFLKENINLEWKSKRGSLARIGRFVFLSSDEVICI